MPANLQYSNTPQSKENQAFYLPIILVMICYRFCPETGEKKMQVKGQIPYMYILDTTNKFWGGGKKPLQLSKV